MSTRTSVLYAVSVERDRQDTKWGTEFDDKNTLNDWTTYAVQYLDQAANIKNVGDVATQKENMIKAAAILVAALEAYERNGGWGKRHYE